MKFKRVDWRNLKYQRNTITGDLKLSENGRKIDHFIFNDNNGFKRALAILRKYGFSPEKETTEQLKRETDRIKEEIKWLDKI